MSTANRPADRPRRAWVWLGVVLCAADLGCARGRSFRSADLTPPLLASLSPRRPARALPGPDAYALAVGRGQATSEAALARNSGGTRHGDYARSLRDQGTLTRSTAPRPSAPVEVALQPPLLPPTELPPDPAGGLKVAESRATPAPAGPALHEVRPLIEAARARLQPIENYQVWLTRQERVAGTLQPAEDVLLSIRREPRAVRIEWPDGPHKGREAIYTAADPAHMHVNMADSPVPLPPLKLALDSPKVRDSSRHSIAEAGLDAVLTRLSKTLDQVEAGGSEASKVTLDGIGTPEGLDRPCHKIVQVKPDGETWIVYLDAETALPALVQARAANGDLLERYAFRDFKADLPELAREVAFDPEARWKGSGGLLGRLARSAATTPKPAATTTR